MPLDPALPGACPCRGLGPRARDTQPSISIQAISQGSIPLLDEMFQRPPLVNWSALSAPIRILPAHLGGGLALLSAEEERAAQWEVWRERGTITCEASNPRFREYVEKGLRRMLLGA